MKQLAIIIPAYKETYLRQALDSIAAQTNKEFTLYVGDDCSPYNIGSIVNEYRNKIDLEYKRFDTNLGGKDLVSQWKRCIDMSQGEPYIWLFSDDDVMQAKCVENFLSLPADDKDNWLIHFDINMIDSDSHVIKNFDSFSKTMTAKEYLDGKLFKRSCISFVVEFVFSRALYNKCNGFENFDLAWGADFITWLKFAGECNGIKTISGDSCKVLWRSSGENISPDKSKPIIIRKLGATIDTMAFVKQWLNKKNYFYTFKYSKFVWGEIKRNRSLLTPCDILNLSSKYGEKIGHTLKSRLSLLYVLFFAK